MFIQEFYTRFISRHETSRLFQAIHRVSRLERAAFLVDEDETAGWPEWPQVDVEAAGVQ